MLIKIFTPGKTKETWLQAALLEYQKRLSKEVKLEFFLVKDDAKLIQVCEKEKALIALDLEGEKLSSEAFAKKLEKMLEKHGGHCHFVIGGPEGLPNTLKTLPSICLSQLTFTGQMTRLILAEQIYRAFEIKKGSAYHK